MTPRECGPTRSFVERASERCDSKRMTLDPASLALRIESKAELWRSLEVVWHAGPVQPNYGKAVAVASFESSAWAGELLVWETGEAELETLRLADGWVVNKHYDFETGEAIDPALDELATLIHEGISPRGALLAWAPARK